LKEECQPVLVDEVSSTGQQSNQYWYISPTSTGLLSDQYSFTFPHSNRLYSKILYLPAKVALSDCPAQGDHDPI